MSWRERRVESWSELQRLLIEVSRIIGAFRPAYVYRGQADRNWRLESTLKREMGLISDRGIALEVEKRLSSEFEARAHAFLTPSLVRMLNDDGDRWSLMQHYGAPTRLLDWSRSPYVAAYFACASNSKTDGAVWFVHVKRLNSAVSDPSKPFFLDGKIGPDFFLEDGFARIGTFANGLEFDRMTAQQGVFTVCTDVLADHADAIAASPAVVDPDSIGKIIIPAALKLEILQQLRPMNISGASIYPGLDGLGKSLAESARLASKFGI